MTDSVKWLFACSNVTGIIHKGLFDWFVGTMGANLQVWSKILQNFTANGLILCKIIYILL